MTMKLFTDRSRIETHLRCARRRWLEYHEGGGGIVPARKNIHLAVGGAVHSGLESLLHAAMEITPDILPMFLGGKAPALALGIEESAVRAALADFSQFAGKLEGDEIAAPSNLVQIAGTTFDSQLAAQAMELGLDPTPFTGQSQQERQSRAERYLYDEQAALVEGIVRAYARRRLRPLLEEFEVLEVEREGEWRLAQVFHDWQYDEEEHECCRICQCSKADAIMREATEPRPQSHICYELWFLSRPDALLRHRQTNELQLLSFKTTGAWDLRKARDIQHDMQGLSEGVEVEQRLGEWWQEFQTAKDKVEKTHRLEIPPTGGVFDPNKVSKSMFNYLTSLSAPPRVSAIRYEFLLKGERWKDTDLSAQLGVDAKIQKSHLIYQYVATSTPKSGKNTESFRVGDLCWSWEFIRIEDQQSSKLYAGNWRPRPVWESGANAIREWIDKLDRSELCLSGEDSTVGLPPTALGFKSDAQTMGVTKAHPLDAVFVPPVTVYRQEDQLLDWVEQIAELERRNAEAGMLVAAAKDAGDRRSLLNRWFPQTRSACEYPTQCWAARERVGVCWAGVEMQARPLEVGAGEYVKRTPNHPGEIVERKEKGSGR